MPKRQAIAWVAVPISALVVLTGCGSSQPSRTSSPDTSTAYNALESAKPPRRPSKISRYPWKPTGWVTGESTAIHFAINTGFCVGEGKPTIDHVRVVEASKAVLMTVFVNFPNRHHRGGSFACAGVGYSLGGTVHLKAPLGHRFLLDGSRDPPKPQERLP